MKVNVISRNLPHLVFLLVIPFLFIILFPSDTFATRVDVDVNNLNNYFNYSPSGGFYPGGVTIQGSSKTMRLSPSYRSILNCSNHIIYSFVLFDNPFSFNPQSSSVSGYDLNYISGDYSTGVVYSYNRFTNDGDYVGVYSSDTSLNAQYSFNILTLGCSPEEVAPALPTPTPTPTPTATPTATPTSEPTPTPTPEEIDPSEYEWNPVEDAIVKYRLISFVLIAAASLLLYHIIIKRVILK